MATACKKDAPEVIPTSLLEYVIAVEQERCKRDGICETVQHEDILSVPIGFTVKSFNDDSLLETIASQQGMRCSAEDPCEISKVKLRDLNWSAYSFDNVIFRNVALVDVNLNSTIFSSVIFDNVEIIATGEKARILHTGRISDSEILHLNLRSTQEQQTHDSSTSRRRDSARIEANINILPSNVIEVLSVQSLAFSDQQLQRVLIDNAQPKQLHLANVVTTEFWELGRQKYEKIYDEISIAIAQRLDALGVPSNSGDVLRVFVELGGKQASHLIPRFGNQDREVVNCTLNSPSELSLFECSPYLSTVLSPLFAFRDNLPEQLDSHFGALQEVYLENISAGLVYGFEEHEFGALIVETLDIALRLSEQLGGLDEGQMEAVQGYIAGRDADAWKTIFQPVLLSGEAQREVGETWLNEEFVDPRSRREWFVDKINELNVVSSNRGSCALDWFAIEGAGADSRPIEIIRQFTNMQGSELRDCIAWYRQSLRYGVRDLGQPGHQPDMRHMERQFRRTHQAISNVEQFAQLALRRHDEKVRLEEVRAENRARRAERRQEPTSLCDQLRNALARAQRECQDGRLRACGEISAVQREIILEGC